MPDCQPYPKPGGNRDHRRDSALTTAAANAAGTEPGIRTRTLPVSSISIAGSAHAGSPAGAVGRRDQHRRKPVRDGAQFLPPAIDLPSADIGATGDIADHRPRRQLAATIARFCSSDQRRRRSGPVITSTRAIAPSLALVQALSFAPMLPDDPHRRLNARRPSADGYRSATATPMISCHARKARSRAARYWLAARR